MADGRLTDMLEDMFARQERLQDLIHHRKGQQFPSIDPDVLMTQIREQMLALMAELFEALEKCAWKPWLTQLPDNALPYEPFKKEMVDALHFFINLCLLAGIDPISLYTGFLQKNRINFNRQNAGYDGRSTKCPGCNDALDDSTGCFTGSDGIWCNTREDWYVNGKPKPTVVP